MNRLSIAAMVLALGAVVVLSTGCGNVSEKVATEVAERATEIAVEKETGEKVKLDASGDVDISALPEFLRYPGAKATSKLSMSTGEGEGTVWGLETADSRTQVGEWYRAQLAGKGWTKISEMEAGESVMLNYQSADEKEKMALVAVTEDGKTTISLTQVVE